MWAPINLFSDNFLFKELWIEITIGQDVSFLFEGLYSSLKQSKCVIREVLYKEVWAQLPIREIKLNCFFKSGVLLRHSNYRTMETQCSIVKKFVRIHLRRIKRFNDA